VCSNEPGYYEDGAFGVRIENLMTVKEVPTTFRCVCVCCVHTARLPPLGCTVVTRSPAAMGRWGLGDAE